MAINFPNSPSNGDVFGNYTYDTSIPGWRKTPENSASLPAGTIVQWPGATAPANWLLADGSAVSRATYASLFAAIGVQYGSGDGTTTFNLPNLKGRVPVGRDSSQAEFDTLGETGGAKTHTLTEAEMPSHTHVQNAHTHVQDSHGHAYWGAQTGQNLSFTNTGNVWTHFLNNYQYTVPAVGGTVATNQNTTATNQNTGGGGAHNNLQPYIVLNYIIKTSAGVTSGDSELATRVGVAEADIDRKWESYNFLLNSAFDIWQRGTSGFTSGYFADRWFLNGANSGSRSTDVPDSSFTYSASATNSSASYAGITQRIEAANAKHLVGTYVTVSGWFKRTGSTNGGTLNINMDYPTAADNYTSTSYVGSVQWTGSAPSSSWVRYSGTFSVPVPNAAVNGIQFSFTHNGSSGNSLGGLWAGLQIEAGTSATPFRRNTPNIQAELAACQRYFTALNSSYVYYNYGAGCTNSTSQSSAIIHLPVEMRTRGTVTSSAANTFGSHIPGIEVSTGTSIANMSMESPRTVYVTLNHNSSGNFGSSRSCFLIANNTTNAYIYANAEL